MHEVFSPENYHQVCSSKCSGFIFISELDNSVIITKKVFAHLLSTMGISKNNSIVPINIEVNELDKQAIVDALVKCEKNIFRQYVLK